MRNDLPVYIGRETIPHLIDFCHKQGFDKFLLVADSNTYAAFGNAVEQALKEQNFDVVQAILTGDEIIADEKYLIQVFLKADRQNRTYLAVGSGTLTDITRFVSHRNKAPFISVPTAPSVDGFASIGAPLVLDGLKQTILCQAPIALFADLPTLVSAPPRLTGSGFGDMVGKLLSIADWKLGHVLYDEPYDLAIEQRSRKAAQECARLVDEIGQGTEKGVSQLMEGLLESGFCMLDFGNSSPASGAEHHLSHYWELKLLRENRPAIFHGVKVGVASIITARWYEAIQKLSRRDVEAMLSTARFPEGSAEAHRLHEVFGTSAEALITEQAEFLFMSEEKVNQLKQRILNCWDEVLEIAAQVPSVQELEGWLRRAGAAVTGKEIGLDDEEVELAKQYGHYIRKRFTINKLRLFLGLP